MNVSAWAIKQPIPSIVLFLVLMIAGWSSFLSIGVDENPNIDIPVVTITVAQVGAAPSELETQVTRKIEDSVAGLGRIKHITSTVTEGASATAIEFELGTNTDRAVNDVRDAVARVRTQLPGSITDPVIQRLDFVGGPFVTYTVSNPGLTTEQLSWLIDDEVSRTLLSVPGVGQVQRSGGVDREIRVELDPAKLEALGLTTEMVNNQIRTLNIDLPGGRGDIGSAEQSIRTLGSAGTLEDFRAARISLPRGGWARLDTLGRVLDSNSEQRQVALLDGEPAVAFSVVRAQGANMVEVAEGIDRKLEQMERENAFPPGTVITKIRTNAKYVEESYDASAEHLVLGGILAVIVIWLWLKDWRAALISGLAMPMSIIPTFWAMKWLGYTLNSMSLLGLALVIGILVDDAIVEIENIVRHIHMGKKPYQAALEAADEIGLAVVATTATIIVVFVPVGFMGGIPGQFFKQFGITVAVAVFFSLLVARLITPMMAAYWMTEPPEEGPDKSPIMRIYDRLLVWSIQHRLQTLLLAFIFFGFSLALFSFMPTNLFPQADRAETVLSLELPPGSTLAQTTAVAEHVTDLLKKRPEVVKVFASVGTPTSGRGRSGGSAAGVNKANLYIVLKPKNERDLSQKEFEDDVRPAIKAVAGVRSSFGMAAGGPSGKLNLVLASDNPAALEKSAAAVIREMRALPILTDVQSQAALLRPEVVVIPDTAKASEQGVSVQSIARTAQIATLGDIDQNLAKFDLEDRQINIRVQLDPRYREDFSRLGDLKVSGTNGVLVPLKNVATIQIGRGPSQIDRYDRQRQVTISSNLATGVPLGTALESVHALPSMKALPKDVHELRSGDAEIQKDVFGGFAWAMGAAVLLIYCVLILLYSDFLHPLTIMVSLPLSIGGALLALVMTQEPLGMFALIGIVMLMGLATKNAILLVDYILMAMHRGVPRAEAVLTAGEARMRPILMTTVAMIAGMLPIALGIGAGSEVRKAMAIAVIGGLITSTFLTLLIVPVVFTYVDDVKRSIIRLFRK